MTYAVIPHRLIPGTSVAGAAQPENLSFGTVNAGGFGTASWTQRTAPGLGVGDAVTIECEGETPFEGVVTAVTGGIGEQLSWRVDCAGNMEKLKADETVEGVFVDRDLAQWRFADCGNWDAAPGFEITGSADGALRLDYPDTGGELLCDRGPYSLNYDHEGNSPPPFDDSDFPEPKKLWSALYYHLGSGLTSKSISRVAFRARWFLRKGPFAEKTTPDYNNPIGPPDEKYGHRFAKYPLMNYWSGLYDGIVHTTWTGDTHLQNLFVGLYCCDDPSELPVDDVRAMKTDPHLLIRFDQGVGRDWNNVKFSLDCSGQFLMLYASYLPIRLPFPISKRFSKNAAHIVRRNWMAANRLYVANSWVVRNCYIELSEVSVCAQGYEPDEDGSDDLAKAIRILYPNSSVAPMKLPAPEANAAPTSIAIRSRTTMLAALTDLLALYERPMAWGIWEDDELIISDPARTEPYEVQDEPGVDTTGAELSSEGAVESVLVAYLPASAPVEAVGKLTISQPALVLVDKDGGATDVAAGWAPAAGERVAYVDATSEAQSREAAVRIGAKIAAERRPDQAAGSIVLRAIAGASSVRAGTRVSAPGVDADEAMVTATRVDVDADTVTLTLGPTGYMGRFPAQVPGRPLTSRPAGQQQTVTRETIRRTSGR